MTKEEAKHFSEILKAYSEGKTIQVREYKGSNTWVDTISTPDFKGNPFDYRIKPNYIETTTLKYLYQTFKRLEEHYWKIFNIKRDRYNESDDDVYLGEAVAYQNIWETMYDTVNNISNKIGYDPIKREIK